MKCAEESVMERSGCEGCGQAMNVATEWVLAGIVRVGQEGN